MIVLTQFDYNKYPPLPLVSHIKTDKVSEYIFYMKGTKKKIYDIISDSKLFADTINAYDDQILMNDVKSHLMAFNITNKNLHHTNTDQDINNYVEHKPAMWQTLLASCSPTYNVMENTPIFLDEVRVYPRYTLDTFTGRSKCTNFNIQGAPIGTPIRTSDNKDIFVLFDWLSADIRVMAALSDDKTLLGTFIKSDPYTFMSEVLQIPRDECKILFLKSIYSINYESPILELFPSLRNWMKNNYDKLSKDNFLINIHGRKFQIDNSRTSKSVFNAVVQSIVADAMHSVLSKIENKFRSMIVTETHDSIVMACRDTLVQHVVRNILPLMLCPLDNLPKFPLRIMVGKKWKEWKLYKEYR